MSSTWSDLWCRCSARCCLMRFSAGRRANVFFTQVATATAQHGSHYQVDAPAMLQRLMLSVVTVWHRCDNRRLGFLANTLASNFVATAAEFKGGSAVSVELHGDAQS